MPYFALGRMEILRSTPCSTRIVVFSMAFRERLLEAVKKPMLVRLLSTLVKVVAGICGWMGAGVISPVGGGGWPRSVFVESFIREGQQQQQQMLDRVTPVAQCTTGARCC
jgi:hypothetical protein